jgi:hypothetical protein
MLEFLGRSSHFGLVPVSTVVLACDFQDRSRGVAQQSFVYQEAAAVPTSARAPPWGLVDPHQISEYDEALDILMSPACRQYIREKRNTELRALLDRFGMRQQPPAQPQVALEARLTDVHDPKSASELPSRCREVIRKLEQQLADLEERLDEVVST